MTDMGNPTSTANMAGVAASLTDAQRAIIPHMSDGIMSMLPAPFASAIDRARPFIDADPLPGRWLASELLTIGWCMLATGRRPAAADEFVNDMIEEARNRWAAGFVANPFDEPVRVRATVIKKHERLP